MTGVEGEPGPGWTRVVVAGPDGDVVAWRFGTGDVPLFFFHGLLPVASGRIGTELVEELARRSRVHGYAVDAPGFGESAAPASAEGYAMERLAGVLGASVAGLAGAPAVLVGHSWGAAIACRIATMLDHRPLGLVLLDGGHFDHADLPEADPSETVDQVRQQMAATGWAVQAPTLDAGVEQVAGSGTVVRPGLREAVRAGLVETPQGLRSRVSLANASAAMHALMNSRSSTTYPAIARRGVPVLLLTATRPEQRAVLNRQRLGRFRAQISDLTVVELASTHDIPVCAPVAAARAVASWLVARGIAGPAGLPG